MPELFLIIVIRRHEKQIQDLIYRVTRLWFWLMSLSFSREQRIVKILRLNWGRDVVEKSSCATKNLCFCCTFSASYIMQSWPQKRTMDKSPIITVNEMVCVAHIGRVDLRLTYIVRLQPRKRFVKCRKSFWWKAALEPSSWISVVHPIGMQTCLNNFCPHNDPFQIEFSPPGQ